MKDNGPALLTALILSGGGSMKDNGSALLTALI